MMDQGILMPGSGTLVNHHHSTRGPGSVLPTQNSFCSLSDEAGAQAEVAQAEVAQAEVARATRRRKSCT